MIKIRRQRPVKGGRIPLPSCVLHEIQREVERAAREHHVSRSFVIATALADYFGVRKQERYDEPVTSLTRPESA